MRRRTRSRAGFAVMELLIAMALLAVIASFVAGSLAFGNRVWERTASVADTGRRLAELGFLRDMLSQALVLRSGGGAEFDGQQNQISFAVLRAAPGFASDQPWRVSIGRHPRDTALTVGLTPMTVDTLGARELRLLENLTGFRVRYRGRLLDGDATRWQPRWQAQASLPDLVEITLAFDDDGTISQRVLAIRPKAR